MNQDSNAILTLCSHLCAGEGIAPLTTGEWAEFEKKLLRHGLRPGDVFELSLKDLGLAPAFADRITRLIDRNASLVFELNKYESMGITAITTADKAYPARLKTALNNSCPPVFYLAGDAKLLENAHAGYVGSRIISDDDIAFTKAAVKKTASYGSGVVSGGAKGIDGVSAAAALAEGVTAIEYLADSMLKRLRLNAVVKAVRDKRLLLLSVAKPDAGFTAGVAMMRNRYIYIQSIGTIVVRSEYNKGGTWAGAIDNIKHDWCTLLCWNNAAYQGNMALIKKGAFAIDDSWDGDICSITEARNMSAPEQLSMFDD